jgi:hypothetical protein
MSCGSRTVPPNPLLGEAPADDDSGGALEPAPASPPARGPPCHVPMCLGSSGVVADKSNSREPCSVGPASVGPYPAAPE